MTWIIAATFRWAIYWKDISQLIVAVGIGLIALGGAYVFNWMRETENKMQFLQTQVDTFPKWFTNEEWKNEVV